MSQALKTNVKITLSTIDKNHNLIDKTIYINKDEVKRSRLEIEEFIKREITPSFVEICE